MHIVVEHNNIAVRRHAGVMLMAGKLEVVTHRPSQLGTQLRGPPDIPRENPFDLLCFPINLYNCRKVSK